MAITIIMAEINGYSLLLNPVDSTDTLTMFCFLTGSLTLTLAGCTVFACMLIRYAHEYYELSV